MKRTILYIAALALLLLGGEGTDIGQLRPVELVKLGENSGVLILETDTGDAGWGLTVDQAVTKLKATTPGEIYLDTAGYLLLEVGTEKYLPQLAGYLKKGTRTAYVTENVNLEEAVVYLRMHRPSGTIREGCKPAEVLMYEVGKLNLKIFQEK